MERGNVTNGHHQDTPPPPPRPPPHQLLRCSSLGNNYRLPNSYSSSMVSQQWNNKSASGGNQVAMATQSSSQTVSHVGRHAVQTQTETKLSCLRQFLFCLLANEVTFLDSSVVIYSFLSKKFSIAKLGKVGARKKIASNLPHTPTLTKFSSRQKYIHLYSKNAWYRCYCKCNEF